MATLIATWLMVGGAILAGPTFLLYLLLQYQTDIEDIKMDIAQNVAYHERIWDPDQECR